VGSTNQASAVPRLWGADLFGVRRAEVIGKISIACVAASLTASPVAAQMQPYKLHCMATGNNAQEALGDREGHSILVSSGTCRVEGGLQDGAIVTQHLIWEIDKGNWSLIGGEGIIRKQGAMSITRTTGTLAMRAENGRVVGWTGAGKGTVVFAVGAAGPLAGKSYSWTARSIAPGQYVNEITPD
jgi:hypothetical protein